MSEYELYNELNISQKPALEVLEGLGYKPLDFFETEKMRGNLYNVVLTDILREKLVELNEYEYKGKKYKFSEKNIEQAIKDLDVPLTDGLIRTNEKIYDILMLGRSYQETLPDGSIKSFSINYIDWNDYRNNDFHVVSEFRVEKEDGQGHVKPDIVLFVNGIPFGVIECKKASIGIEEGISQMLRNQGKEYIPQLFKYSQMLMSTNKNETEYATCYTPRKFWTIWHEQDEEWLQKYLSKVVEDRIPTNQDKNIVSLFSPERLLDFTKYYVLYDKNVKKIARYQQFFAIKEIIKAIKEADADGNRRSGVIWHTQGSGKSLTMVMLSKYILTEFSIINPKVVVVTDRINLDKQIHQTFNHTKLKASRATTGKHLVRLLDDNADIITTLIHKFDTAASNSDPIMSKNIFVLVDESHRTNYGELHLKMKQVFPNACYLGFTGTPLMKEQKKNTVLKFGGFIHTYTITDGVRDKIIVPLLYEGKMIGQSVNQKAIDNRLEIITRNLNDKQKEEVMRKWSRFEKIASSDQRIKMIAFDINNHFVKNYKKTNSNFKAMLATNSRPEAIRYLEEFEALGDINAMVVISPPDQREGYDEVDASSKNKVKQFWDKIISEYQNEEAYEDYVKEEFISGDKIDLLIVVDKLLTGFDAPRATVMYIDKSLKEHNLLQAIARVNRLCEGKDYGIIIDYRGLLSELDEALEMYSGAGLEKFDPEDLKNTLYDVIKILGSLRQNYTDLTNIFIGIRNKNDIEEYEVLLSNEKLREEFYKLLSNFGRDLSIVFESERIYNSLGNEELEKYKHDFKFYQELRKNVKIRYSDSIDYKEYEGKMQSLMDNYIAAEEVIRITNPVDIMDEKGFAEELERLGSLRSKADAIRTRITKTLSTKWDENPAYYKRFSERITETLQAYQEMRISEKEYFNKMTEIMQDYKKGYSGMEYPNLILSNSNAKAFYGVAVGVIKEKNEIYGRESEIASLSLDIDQIFDDCVQVEWHNNVEINKRIEQKLDDLLYKFCEENDLKIEYPKDVDRIIDTVKTVALRRYK